MNTFNEALGRSLPTSQAVAKVTGMVEFAEDQQFKGLLVWGYTFEDATPLDHKTGQGAKPSAFWMYFSQAAEVFVDTDTGVVKVLKFASAHDVGKAINPLLLEGQIEGACMMGLGEALHEEMVYHEGQVINPNFLDYRFPTFLEAPEILPLIVECPHGDGPFGAKGMGEPALAAVAASVGNAVFDAVGIRITSLSITPENLRLGVRASYQHSVTKK